MKAIFASIYGLFTITAIVTHIWTVIIAFTVGGFWGGVITLFLPVIGEIYWMIKMFGVNDTYAYIALAHLILAIPISILGQGER
jgi:hypothetical protein